MRKTFSHLAPCVLVATVVLLATDPAFAQEDKGVDSAKKVLMQFATKVTANDLESVMKTVDVPFLQNFNAQGKKELTRDQEGLKKKMQQLLDVFKGKKVKMMEVEKTITYAKFLETDEGGKLEKEFRKLLDETFPKAGYLLRVQVKDAEGKHLNTLTFFVANRGDETRIVGILD